MKSPRANRTGSELSAIAHFCYSSFRSAMGAAIHPIVLFYAVSYDPAGAMRAGWCHGMNCAFEAIEYVRLAGNG
ncbi:MAG: hypothetical protein JO333_14175 [Verrucomicrobia bacterium]|nr:hypothetical protein [Verrucomicrobiota bacterium]